jgi:RNA polymerase sigma-32 factor
MAKTPKRAAPAKAPKKVKAVIVDDAPKPKLALDSDDAVNDDDGAFGEEDSEMEGDASDIENDSRNKMSRSSGEEFEDSDDEGAMPVVYNPYDPKVLESVEKQICATDPLKRYLQEIKNAPTLTPEQEAALVQRMHDNNDINAAKFLVSANLRTVVRIAYEYRSMYHNLLDLIQEGNIGLMKAVSKFDPTKGARLGYYASWWIRSYILKYLLDNFRMVRVGTTAAQKKLFYHLMREKQRLEAQGIVAAPALIAQNLHVKEKDVVEMEQRLLQGNAEVSLDAQSPGNDSDRRPSLLQQLFDPKTDALSSIEHDELIQMLQRELPEFRKSLNDKEKMVLDARILSEEPQTLQEVADEFGLTRERVRQIESKLIEKLRQKLLPLIG